MNIMLATVTERTREIGIRRALGAKRRDLVFQFLIETAVISATGGAIGVAPRRGRAAKSSRTSREYHRAPARIADHRVRDRPRDRG